MALSLALANLAANFYLFLRFNSNSFSQQAMMPSMVLCLPIIFWWWVWHCVEFLVFIWLLMRRFTFLAFLSRGDKSRRWPSSFRKRMYFLFSRSFQLQVNVLLAYCDQNSYPQRSQSKSSSKVGILGIVGRLAVEEGCLFSGMSQKIEESILCSYSIDFIIKGELKGVLGHRRVSQRYVVQIKNYDHRGLESFSFIKQWFGDLLPIDGGFTCLALDVIWKMENIKILNISND